MTNCLNSRIFSRRQVRPEVVPPASLSGVSRDSSGVALPYSDVKLFRAEDDTLANRAVSDGSGNFSFGVNSGRSYYDVAHKTTSGISFTAAGVFIGNESSITPGLPAGFQADDVFVLVATADDQSTLTFPVGWNVLLDQKAIGSQLRTFVAWRRAVAGDTDPLILGASNGNMARIFGFRGCSMLSNPFRSAASRANPASAVLSAPGVVADAGDMVLFVGSMFDAGAQTVTSSLYSGVNPSFTEAAQDGHSDSVQGWIMEQFLAYGSPTAKADTRDRNALVTFGTALNANNVNIGALLALMPATATVVAGATTNRLVGS